MVTDGCEVERTQAGAEETWLYVGRGISPHTDRSRLEGFPHAPPSREGDQDRDVTEHSERSRLKEDHHGALPGIIRARPDGWRLRRDVSRFRLRRHPR